MKKLLCVLLVLIMTLSFAACDLGNKPQEPNEGDKIVTIYVPETVTVTADGQSGTMKIILEEGWQTKDSILAQFRMEDPKDSRGYNMYYELNATTIDYGEGGQKIVAHYDKDGNMTSQTVYFPMGASVEKNETVTTYDSRGRTVRQESRIYYADRDEPVTQAIDFNFTDTETGSKGTTAGYPVGQEMYYDAQDRLIRSVTYSGATEVTRTENTYDEQGNLVISEIYVSGVLTSKTETTYQAVQVSQDKAQQHPYFKCSK